MAPGKADCWYGHRSRPFIDHLPVLGWFSSCAAGRRRRERARCRFHGHPGSGGGRFSADQSMDRRPRRTGRQRVRQWRNRTVESLFSLAHGSLGEPERPTPHPRTATGSLFDLANFSSHRRNHLDRCCGLFDQRLGAASLRLACHPRATVRSRLLAGIRPLVRSWSHGEPLLRNDAIQCGVRL